jgi:hypothetical protein
MRKAEIRDVLMALNTRIMVFLGVMLSSLVDRRNLLPPSSG